MGKKTAPPSEVAGLTPLLRQLVALVGRRADDPELVAFVTKTLGQKVPGPTADRGGGKNVVARKHGIEMVFDHDIKNERYPLVPKTKKTFVPYLQLAWLTEKFPGALPFGIAHGMEPDEVTERLGVAPGERGSGKYRYWRKVLDPARDIVLDVDADTITIGVDEARELASRHHPSKQVVGLFLAWAVSRDLIEESRFPGHADLLAAVRRKEQTGSELLATALPRGVWDVHLKDWPGLRDFAFGWFCNIDHGYIIFDLIKVFGSRPGEHGHDEPVLDADDWKAVGKAAKALDKRFAEWV
jgi:hypothetical protein